MGNISCIFSFEIPMKHWHTHARNQTRSTWQSNFLVATFILVLVVILSPGCNSTNEDDENQQDTQTTEQVGIAVNVLVVEDDKIGSVLKRQYNARENGDATITEISWQDLVDSEFAAVKQNDIVIYPTRRMGELVTRDLLAPLTEENTRFKDSEPRTLLFADRGIGVSWGDQQYGMSMGQSHWVAIYRQELLAEDIKPPKNWKQFNKFLKRAIKDAPEGVPTRVAFPMSDHWASYSLLSHVASAIRIPGKYSTFFDVSTMDPLIDNEPFLESLNAMQKYMQDSEALSPKELLSEYSAGNIGIAFAPLNSFWLPQQQDGDSFPKSVVALVPGYAASYDASRGSWQDQYSGNLLTVPVIGGTGMLASMSASCEKQRNTVEVIQWITSKQISAILSVESENTGLSRKSHLGNPAKWLGENFPNENGTQFASTMTTINSSRRTLQVLRIPESDQYLELLDDAVRQVVLNGANSVEVTAGLDRQWNALTEKLDLETVKAHYRFSEGLSN